MPVRTIEFEVEHPADLSGHGAADRQLAHEMCFSIDDRMLPHLLGADLSFGCDFLRALHEDFFASTAKHRSAVVGDAQVADGSQRIAGSGESAIQTNSHAILEQSRATSETSDMFQECFDLLPPSGTRKLHSAIVRKAAGWAVMDTNTRLSNDSASMPKGAKGESKSAYSASVPCKLFTRGASARCGKFKISHR